MCAAFRIGRGARKCNPTARRGRGVARPRLLALALRRLRGLRLLAPDLAHDVLLAPRDGERLPDALQHDFPVRVALVADAALEPADRVACDEAVAVDADETRAELLLEARQRLLEQVLALRRADRDVLELGLEVDDLVERNQDDARALGHRQEAARGRGQLVEL